MTATALSSETIHATSVAIGGRAVLICGQSGAGKSDLALRLIDRGGTLVSDDYTYVRRVDGRLLASAPDTIRGRMEVRGIGIVAMDAVEDAPVALMIDVDRAPERLPMLAERRRLAGVDVPVVPLAALEASAAIKAELALKIFGLAEQ
ncbi:HPr kinase/phosphorylase [Allosphingosinicella vermicomposti]|uniref:HPr kinase/phosphorylase n=1 Tax=Allosphingosinicella vermicomposti TaxID=614671 RepID=UPI000D114EE0|nr:HPr kinase/phosphatase C-terminal domain-containing protein [Allosphingosinicella vermicomposti]